MTQEIREWAMKLAECAGQDQQRAEEFVACLLYTSPSPRD